METQMQMTTANGEIRVKNGNSRWTRPVFFDGEVYQSSKAAAEVARIHPHAMYQRASMERDPNSRWATKKEIETMVATYGREIKPLRVEEGVKKIFETSSGHVLLGYGKKGTTVPVFLKGEIYTSCTKALKAGGICKSSFWALLKSKNAEAHRATLEECSKKWPGAQVIWNRTKTKQPTAAESVFDNKSSVTEIQPETPPEVSLYSFVGHTWSDQTITVHMPGSNFYAVYESMGQLATRPEILSNCKFE